MFALEKTAYFPYFVKMLLCNLEENIYSAYVCDFLKVCNLISKKDKIMFYAPFETMKYL